MIDIFFVEDIFPRSEGVEIDGTAESGFEDIGDESFVESGEAFVYPEVMGDGAKVGEEVAIEG